MARREASPARIMRMARAFWETKALTAAVELGLFSRFDRRTFTVDEACRELSCSRRGMEAILVALTSLTLLKRAANGSYRVAPEASRYLVTGKGGYVGDYVLLAGNRMYKNWLDLTARIREGTNAAAPPGEDVFASMPAEEVRRFTLGMHGMSQDSAKHVFSKVSLAGRRRLVDVGGGSGAFVHEALKKWKRLEGVVFDRGPVLDVARDIAEREKLGARMTFKEGDLFKGPFPPADAMVLSKILHDWGPEKDRRILENCHAALERGGLLVIAEWFLDDDRTGPKDAALGSLNMLAETEGANYSWNEYEEWARAAGFTKTRRVSLPRAGVINGALVFEKIEKRGRRFRVPPMRRGPPMLS